MIAYEEVRRKLTAFSSGRLSLDAFQNWLLPLSWDVDSRGIPDAVAPIRLVAGMMAEHSLRHRSLRSLRAETGKIVKAWGRSNAMPLMVREGTTEVAVKRKSRRPARRSSSKR